jgi:hypothetical protein
LKITCRQVNTERQNNGEAVDKSGLKEYLCDSRKDMGLDCTAYLWTEFDLEQFPDDEDCVQ